MCVFIRFYRPGSRLPDNQEKRQSLSIHEITKSQSIDKFFPAELDIINLTIEKIEKVLLRRA